MVGRAAVYAAALGDGGLSSSLEVPFDDALRAAKAPEMEDVLPSGEARRPELELTGELADDPVFQPNDRRSKGLRT
jgi:hypothetical protein